ncbi:hypothetical protein GCM10010275_30130 [Streptomyces litmocidini]|uniref:DUF6221 family protein n=1 Tax=Streptomyces litmocidini TaxID=67318 RepID=UPI00167EB229|nr:DUF6221 family protein [Streptomyces litmocidini]GGU91064.1 hypothetical protein GCM10010275_30130 [Streptomyces litmocidini]
MDDLIAFLRARLDDDGREAKARRGVFPSPSVQDDGYVWLHVRPGGNAVITRYPHPVEGYDDMAKLRNWADTEHGWTQERVLAEVDAKRRITECHEPWTAANGDIICGRCGREHIDGRPGGHFPCQTLRLLALPFADHPDYQDAWRP